MSEKTLRLKRPASTPGGAQPDTKRQIIDLPKETLIGSLRTPTLAGRIHSEEYQLESSQLTCFAMAKVPRNPSCIFGTNPMEGIPKSSGTMGHRPPPEQASSQAQTQGRNGGNGKVKELVETTSNNLRQHDPIQATRVHAALVSDDDTRNTLDAIATKIRAMSMLEKIRFAIRLGHNKKGQLDRYDQQALVDSVERLNVAMTMGRYDAVDSAHHISSRLDTNQGADIADRPMQDWETSSLRSNDPVLGPLDPGLSRTEQRRLVSQHRNDRMFFVSDTPRPMMAAGRRLQAAAGVFNDNVFRIPCFQRENVSSSQIMDIDPPASEGRAMDAETTFRGLFEKSKASGYRTMTLASINFQVPNSTSPFPLEYQYPQRELPLQTEAHLRSVENGSITVFELDMDSCIWLVFEMKLPLAEVEGHCPRELEPMPTSCLRFAVPRDKVTAQTVPPTLNKEPQRPRQRLELCRDSIPQFVTESKNLYIPKAHQGFEDFFQATKVTGMEHSWKGKRTKPWVKRRERSAFWKAFRMAAQRDKTRWAVIQSAMARGQCVIDMEILEPWRNVPGTTAANSPSESPKSHTKESPERRRKQQRSSGLRHEVKF
ncbi:hypothetical protein ACRALDRAFT_1071696 [Sodiomyces alcalophilus JCM 7366]|uniref:uncharacterized protein n=1 Tax=Sodiomyces alcalophilus JCM 7366 TaxID=591952 RepID=UPI0039B63440